MTDKEKIREEVERLFNNVKNSNFESDVGAFYYLKDLLDYIDSLQEEPVSEDLEKAAKDYGIRQGVELKPFAIKYFKAGAKWKEQQMMSKAIDGKLYSTICGSEQNIVVPAGYGEYGKDGDKVKAIILKDERL